MHYLHTRKKLNRAQTLALLAHENVFMERFYWDSVAKALIKEHGGEYDEGYSLTAVHVTHKLQIVSRGQAQDSVKGQRFPPLMRTLLDRVTKNLSPCFCWSGLSCF